MGADITGAGGAGRAACAGTARPSRARIGVAES
jgi:hypothetical protein